MIQRVFPLMRPCPGPLLAFAAVTSLMLSGCATAPTNPAEGLEGASRSEVGDVLRIQVRNRNFEEALIFGDHAGGRTRIGVVPGRTDRVLAVSWPDLRAVEFSIRLGDARSCRTRSHYVGPGQVVTLIIEENFPLSPACMGA